MARESSFIFQKMYQNCPTAMANSNISPGIIPRTPVLRDGKVCFSSENVPLKIELDLFIKPYGFKIRKNSGISYFFKIR